MLPFYKTFPFMDYYKNEEAFAKDLRMIKDMYPLDTAMIQSAVEQRMDELEYEGSFIYDEVPDRQRLFDEADRIAGRFISEQSSRCFICTIAGILLTVNSADADADTEGTKDSGRYKDMIL